MCQKIEQQLIDKMMERLRKAFPEGNFEFDDSDMVHIKLAVKSHEFAGKPLVDQHRLVYDALGDLLHSGELHSIKIKTLSP